MTPQETLDIQLCNAIEKFSRCEVDNALAMGADPNAIPVGYVNTPLGIAAKNGDTALIHRLLSMKADINKKNVHGDTPLHLAAVNNRYDVMVMLWERGADVYAKNNAGQTPADAAKAAHKETMEMFLRMVMAKTKINLFIPIPAPGNPQAVDPFSIIPFQPIGQPENTEDVFVEHDPEEMPDHTAQEESPAEEEYDEEADKARMRRERDSYLDKKRG